MIVPVCHDAPTIDAPITKPITMTTKRGPHSGTPTTPRLQLIAVDEILGAPDVLLAVGLHRLAQQGEDRTHRGTRPGGRTARSAAPVAAALPRAAARSDAWMPTAPSTAPTTMPMIGQQREDLHHPARPEPQRLRRQQPDHRSTPGPGSAGSSAVSSRNTVSRSTSSGRSSVTYRPRSASVREIRSASSGATATRSASSVARDVEARSRQRGEARRQILDLHDHAFATLRGEHLVHRHPP